MPCVVAKGPDGKAELSIELDDTRVVVVGRHPDLERAQLGAEGAGRHVEAAEVSGASVSANHLAVWSENETVCVRDIGSRNGTLLVLPKDQTVRVAGGNAVVHLADRTVREAAAEEPLPPVWSTPGEYDRGMADAVERWLATHGVQVRPQVVADGGESGSGPSCFPLATGHVLDIVLARTTTDTRWPRLLEQLWKWVLQQNASYNSEEATRREGCVLASRAIRVTHAEVVAAAERGVQTLLISGPSGSGKEMLAEVFHRHSGRAGPLITINCAMLDSNLLRSELFGAEAGSFTTGSRRIVGAAERARGGTLFLDEIGEVKLEQQAMLLRFLDQREIATIGKYGVSARADVRIVAATNRDLRRETLSGGFRSDVWFRLSVCEVEVPPLRRRWEDVLRYLEGERSRDGRSIRDALSPEALDLLRTHPWEGNFRELRSFAERLLGAGLPERIDVATCRRALERISLRRDSAPAPLADGTPADWAALVARSIQAFVEDHDREPASWDDQRDWNEKYLKPLVFFHLSGAPAQAPGDDDGLRNLAAKAATRLRVDRGTAMRHMARYFDRFQK